MTGNEDSGDLGRMGDPVAERVVAELVAEGRLGEVNRLLREWRSNDQALPEGLPAPLREFLEQARGAVPDWADQTRLRRVREFFQDDGIHIGASLALGSMALAYAVPLGAKMMSLTHRLKYPERRMANTAQFVFDLMSPDPFGPDSRFVVSAVKVRLIHATIRHHLRASGSWDEERDKVPASQEHLLIVWLALSVQVIDFLGRLRVTVTDEEAEDYLHTWRVAGTFLGISPDAMPDTTAQARQVLADALARGGGPSPEGVELTGHLLDLYADAVPGRLFDGIVPAYLRHLVGKDIAGWLEVPRSWFWQAALGGYLSLVGLLEKVEDRFHLGKRVLDKAGQVICDLEFRILTHGKSAPLELPLELAGYNPDPGQVASAAPVEHAGEQPVIPVEELVAEILPEPRAASEPDLAASREPGTRP
ncbi:hypothetical protein FHS29_002400 [Saccharothrix tamanrassetensis]|uniref:ER-bound oxygenase mpaB/mpaB'/Rubber oxygenase catalytic domain-containing protein n=1 Tax=Saccharothrix tamanrassetensis TaxID=1051531 RepID=A0A841CEP4_9PSEU|nr:oxygenase MpaB family protein [Saccharothrix tamanrassetensis]MBB5955819.1 hypothetical protein [Saccharothrix tamanrassetensis]